jgi:hypothetical protein
MFDYEDNAGNPIVYCKKCDEDYRQTNDIRDDEMECPGCGMIIPNESKFCPECGKVLSQNIAPKTSTPNAQVPSEQEDEYKKEWENLKKGLGKVIGIIALILLILLIIKVVLENTVIGFTIVPLTN